MAPAKTWADVGIDLEPGRRGEVDTTCPQCSHKRKKRNAKCLSVNVEEGVWLCMHCGWSGSLRQGQRTPSGEPEYGAPLRKEWVRPRPVTVSPEEQHLRNVVAWFKGRGIPEDVMERNRVQATIAYMPQAEENVRVVAFPFYRNGELVNIKYRDGKKRFCMVAGAERVLYGLDDCLGAEKVVIVEGEIDKLSVEVAGYTACMSVPDGAPPEHTKNLDGKLTYLGDPIAEGIFREAREIVLACDADGPGQRLQEELSRIIGRVKCARVTWPEGIKDANDALVNVGPWFLAECIEQAEPFPVEGIVHIRDLADEILRYYDDGLPKGASTGWRTLDPCYRVLPGSLTVLTASPGVGKSTWLDALLVNLAVREGWTFGICSPEYKPLARHAIGLLTAYHGKPFDKASPFPRMARGDVEAGIDWLHERFAFVEPQQRTIQGIMDRAYAMILRMGLRGLVVDPWNQIDHRRPESKTGTEYASEVLGALGDFAREFLVHVWLVAHPTKQRKDAAGTMPVPTPYDISGSAAFYDKADFCLALWRDKEDERGPTQVHVQKVRFPEVGKLGMVQLGFEAFSGRFHDLDRRPSWEGYRDGD